MANQPPLQPAVFQEMVYAASKTAFTTLRATHSNEHFYTFGLFTDDSLQFLYPVANSEEALTATVEHYNEKVDPNYGCTSTRTSMRWSYGDWGYFPDAGGGSFDEINRVVHQNFDSYEVGEEFTKVVQSLCLAMLAAFRRLDDEQFFGVGAKRSKITLLIVGDLPIEWVETWVTRSNPPDVAQQFLNWKPV